MITYDHFTFLLWQRGSEDNHCSGAGPGLCPVSLLRVSSFRVVIDIKPAANVSLIVAVDPPSDETASCQ
jgi:hypothetical protein